MRIAILSDIHGNRTAFHAVLADLRKTAPDQILLGGDIADSGSSPAEIVDQIRDLGWQGVAGNTDEMLFAPQVFADYAATAPQFERMFAAIGEMAAATREALGEIRLAWLRQLQQRWDVAPLALVHGSPDNKWTAAAANAPDSELSATYGVLNAPVVVYGHIHKPYIRIVGGRTVANCGSVGLPQDGDPRASYLVLDHGKVEIRRVEYDVTREIQALIQSGLPHAEWVGSMLQSASFQAR